MGQDGRGELGDVVGEHEVTPRDEGERLRCAVQGDARSGAGAEAQVRVAHVEFDYDFNCIVCAKADLDARNPYADPAMARYVQQLIDAAAMSQQATMLDDVRRMVLLLLPSGRCSIEQVAEHLGIGCRTVQRRLAEEGKPFSSVVNAIRMELAARHVIETNRPLTEVATLLGFSAPSGFSRWYHAQFGCSPKESRTARGPSDSRRTLPCP